MNVHVSYVLELKICKQNFRLSVWMSCPWAQYFWRSLRIWTKVGGSFLHLKCGPGIEIQSQIMILILIRILLLKKN